jgi:predicted PurR-regulated permease PerM
VLLVAVREILLPFVIGMFAAYFLDPAADRLEKWGMSRSFATFLITTGFFLFILLLLALLVPMLFNQFSELAKTLPDYVNSLQQHYGSQLRALFLRAGDGDSAKTVHEAAQSASGAILGAMAKSAGGMLQSGLALVNLFALIFIAPVVAFYLLRDWDKLVAKVDSLLPRRQAPLIREQMHAIDQVLSGFIHGQTNVCLFLAVYYSIALTLVGLQYSLVLGLAAGLLTMIPYVGALFGLALGLLLAAVQFGDMTHVVIVGAIFLIGQFTESNFVTPKLVGHRVGLHPVWVIFGLLAGGALFGFVGVLVAVPVTASIGVLVRYGVSRYLESRYYKR